MTLNVKDSENPAAPAAPAAPTASAPKSPAEAPARPQPVALEVPVTVNGARTVEGSDKREPFSEKSATVLVFGHGAVIRISALLAPGQLIFLTNEKTKKEVVCQVVKSKTDGNAVGYVELRFTEPAPGFWGMRFPSDTVLPQAPSRPAAPAPVPAAPKVAPPAPAAPPVAAQPVAPAPPVPAKPVIAPPPAPVAPNSPVATTPEVHSTPMPSIVSAPPAVEPKHSFPTPPPPASFAPAPIATHAQPPVPPAIVEAPPAPVASAPVSPVIESKPPAPATSAPVSSSSGPSTEELKQQAARLQEQLSSLLFTEGSKPAAPAAPSSSPAPEAAQKVFELASIAPEAAPTKPVKNVPPQPKPGASSLEVEEIKIPSWLAPLARESETPAPAANAFHVEGTNSDVESVIPPAPQEVVLAEAQESARRPETAVFGGQLLGEAAQPANAANSKSKAGLFIGIAASLLLVAGGVWYSHQPGNAISAMLSGGGSKAEHAVSLPVPASSSKESAPAPVAAGSAPAPAPARENPHVEPATVPSAPVERTSRNANPAPAPTSRNTQPAVEEPKKPSLGDVHLATPVINHEAPASSSSSAPALEINSPANASPQISSLSDTHRAGPAAPAPVGGDVKPAKLVKSVPPVYPDLARNQRISGNVQIDALIDAEGNVSTMKVLSGPPLLHKAALDALKQWKYEPAQLDGKPTSMHLTVTIQFRTQ